VAAAVAVVVLLLLVVDNEANWHPVNSMELIKLDNITKTYHVGELDVPVLKGVSLRIDRGELVALMGASGSGKSTLMNILGCLDRPTSGDYWLDGREVSRINSDERAKVRNSKIGFVFQSFNLLPRTSALDQVMMPLTYTHTGLSEREGRQRAMALLQRVGLADRMDHEPSQLSGGQQQRVAIARALINRPPLLFADEPIRRRAARCSRCFSSSMRRRGLRSSSSHTMRTSLRRRGGRSRSAMG
jgi:ABC-type lipoprotein export system ATPase subunit